jgi:hypothetical protein
MHLKSAKPIPDKNNQAYKLSQNHAKDMRKAR